MNEAPRLLRSADEALYRAKHAGRNRVVAAEADGDAPLRLINAAGNLFRRTLLMTLYGTGMRRSELASLKVGDIDSQRMIIRVVAGKGGKRS